MKNRYKVPAGLSDHSGNINTLLAATAVGADLIEFHVTFSKKVLDQIALLQSKFQR